jgi:hypothetical protein
MRAFRVVPLVLAACSDGEAPGSEVLSCAAAAAASTHTDAMIAPMPNEGATPAARLRSCRTQQV